MAFAGLKKQINKANQYMNEKIGGAEGTKLDDEFVDMEKRTDTLFELVDELQLKTKEYLQPNPTARAKMAAVKGISKLSGQAKASTYPQPEGTLGECLTTYGRRLSDESVFAQAMIETGESMKLMADVKYSLDDNVKQNFLEPLHQLQTKDLKEVMHHRKKLQGRRLDFDCKKRRQTKVGSRSAMGSVGSVSVSSPFGSPSHSNRDFNYNDEIKQAEDKFAESLHLAQMGMFNLLENDVEQVNQLATFAECLLEYHKACTEILQNLVVTLQEKREEAASRPKPEFVPKTVHQLQLHLEDVDGAEDGHGGDSNFHQLKENYNGTTPQKSPLPSPGGHHRASAQWDSSFQQSTGIHEKSANGTPITSPNISSPARTPGGPSCQALYDFDAENQGELGFKEGDMITLVSQIDDNWYEGRTLDGKTGYFPVSYVQVLVQLPH